MNITTKSRYAVMAMVDIAINYQGSPISLQKISSRQDITLNYLEQIFMKLRKEGLVKSIRGPGGGYVLAKSTDKISICDIVSSVDESIIMTRCTGNDDEEGCFKNNTKCATHHLWEGLTNKINDYLESVNLSDICNSKDFSSNDNSLPNKLVSG